MIRTHVKLYFIVISVLIMALYFFSWSIYQQEQEITQLKKSRFEFYVLIKELSQNDKDFNYIINRHIVNKNEHYTQIFKPFLGLTNFENIKELKLKMMTQLDLIQNEEVISQTEKEKHIQFIQKLQFSKTMLKDIKKVDEFGLEILKLNIEALNAFHGYAKDDKGFYTQKVKPNKQKALDILYSQKYSIYNEELQQHMNNLEEYVQTLMYKQIEQKKQIQDQYDEIDTIILVLFGIMIILGIYYSIYKIVLPLSHLIEWTKQVEKGEYSLDKNDELKNEIGVLMHSFDIMAQKVKENIASLEKISLTDQLTKLHNRRCIDQKLEELDILYKRYQIPFSVILIDIDFFKSVNDTFGHDVGDSVLQEFAKILKTNIRSSDFAGRWGGEEFLIVCPNTQNSEVKTLAEHLRQSIESFTFSTVGKKTASLGIATMCNEISIAQLIEKADKALYLSKHNGRNCVH